MRRLWGLSLAMLLAAFVAAPVSAGANTSNTSGTGRTIYGEWSSGEAYGYAYVGQEEGQPGFADIYLESGAWVECSPPEGEAVPGPETIAPADTGPGDGFYGFVGTRTFGYSSDVEITFARRLENGSATGLVELWTETIDECAGIYGEPTYELADLSIVVTGAGDLATFRGSGGYQVPSEFNGHQRYRGKERLAAGSILAGPIEATFDFAYLSEVTWTEHVNS